MQAWRKISNQADFFLRKQEDRASVSTTGSSLPRNQPQRMNFAHKKEKVQLCKKFMERGYCPYNNKCKFAHGSHELRINQDEQNSRYKTKMCSTYFKNGSCHYGYRCNFLHKNLVKGIESFSKWKEMRKKFPQIFFQCKKNSRLIDILSEDMIS